MPEFIDNPLRHYSSGMYLRLAFSVAINMNPDILLADEILAVGDLVFQERCLQRVAEEAKKGLTVLFVSHDMAAVSRLCQKALWLRAGEAVKLDEAASVVADYHDSSLGALTMPAADERATPGSRYLEVVAVRLISAVDGRVIGAAPITEDVCVRIRVKVLRLPMKLQATIDVHMKNIFVFRSAQPEPAEFDEPGIYDIIARIPANLLAETDYTVSVSLDMQSVKSAPVNLPKVLTFMGYGSAYASFYKDGVIMPKLDWSVETAHIVAAQIGDQ